jgi:hypothetical protein
LRGGVFWSVRMRHSPCLALFMYPHVWYTRQQGGIRA